MERKRMVAAAAGAVMFLSYGPAIADEDKSIVEKLEHGQVNWTKKTVIATGSGAPNLKLSNVAQVRLAAERAAKLDAHRNILETLKGVKITAATLGAEPLADGQVRTQIEGIVRGCKVIDTRYYSDGGVDVVLECPLDGGLSTVLTPSKEQKPVSTTGEAKYTGLIVDAVGLGVKPALAPNINDAAGKEIYGKAMVNPNFLRQHGVAVYVRSVDEAKQNGRVGANPLVLKASKVGGVASDLEISGEDAEKLSGQNLTFLAEARVVIATDGP